MRATDRTVIASMLLLLTNDLCSSFVIGPSSSTRGLNTFHQPPRIIRDDTNDVQRRNHVFAYYPKGEESSSSLKSQEGQQQSLQSLERKIEELSERLKNEPNEMFEEEAAKLELELRQEITSLSQKLDEAETARLNDKDLLDTMAKSQKALEKDISDLRKQYEGGTDWKFKYEEEMEKRDKQEAATAKELSRLQQEVRIVFSIGRRTSDKMVDKMQTMLGESEEKLTMTADELNTSKQRLAELEEERQSLKKLWGLSWRLTSQRLGRRLSEVRKKILSRPLPMLKDKEPQKSKQEAIRVRKSRTRDKM